MFVIRNWAVVSTDSPFMAPELHAPRLQGKVYFNPNFPDGATITTSRILAIKKATDGAIVETKNSKYFIWESDIDPDYAKVFPEAFASLIKNEEKVN